MDFRLPRQRRSVHLAMGMLAVLLAACEPAFDADIAADSVGESAVAARDPVRVVLPLDGVTLSTEGGETRRLQRDEPASVDLLRFDGQSVFGLLSNRKISAGRYTGVQLLIDDSEPDAAYVETLAGGAPLPIELPTTALTPVPVSFSITDDSNDRESITLVIDLRLSLALRDDERYVLNPVLRAVRNGDAAALSGEVSGARLSNPACARGAAVYLFQGKGADPDERDGVAAEPYATASVIGISGSSARYSLSFLPAGAYTLALTCDAEREDGIDAAADEILFDEGIDINLDEGETAEFDL